MIEHIFIEKQDKLMTAGKYFKKQNWKKMASPLVMNEGIHKQVNEIRTKIIKTF